MTLLFLVAAGCATKPALAGADRDVHGCIASAGYTWSSLENKCIRLWEDGFALTNAQDVYATTAAYVVLSASGTQAELFLPNLKNCILLDRGFTPDGPYWQSADKIFKLQRLPAEFKLFENGVLIYGATQVIK